MSFEEKGRDSLSLEATFEIVSREYAVRGIDLADEVQELVVTDHDGTVLARRGLKHIRAWQLTDALVWARQQARTAGFEDVVVACEPTGHRWRVVAEQCDTLALDLVCVQPLLVTANGNARTTPASVPTSVTRY